MERIKTKDRILLAALDLFSEKGYDQASIDLIAEAREFDSFGSPNASQSLIRLYFFVNF